MSSGHVFRNPDKVQQLPFRDYIRDKCKAAKDGISVLDLDLVINRFGIAVGRPQDADGQIILVEIKNKGSGLNYTQGRTMDLLHRLLRKADPERKHYFGSYLLHWDYEENKPWSLNWKKITEQEFIEWVNGVRNFGSLFDESQKKGKT